MPVLVIVLLLDSSGNFDHEHEDEHEVKHLRRTLLHLLFSVHDSQARVVEWQTRTFEGRMPKGMRVQVPPRARFSFPSWIGCFYQGFALAKDDTSFAWRESGSTSPEGDAKRVVEDAN